MVVAVTNNCSNAVAVTTAKSAAFGYKICMANLKVLTQRANHMSASSSQKLKSTIAKHVSLCRSCVGSTRICHFAHSHLGGLQGISPEGSASEGLRKQIPISVAGAISDVADLGVDLKQGQERNWHNSTSPSFLQPHLPFLHCLFTDS